jgi:D-xylose reductase
MTTGFLMDLLAGATIPPAVLQVEMHPYLTQERLVRFAAQNDIAVTAFSPLGAGSYVQLGMAETAQSVLEHPVVGEIAERVAATPAQVVLAWAMQRGTNPIVKSSSADRLRENLGAGDLTLSQEDMAAISGLNQNLRFNDPGQFCESAFNTFCPIFD